MGDTAPAIATATGPIPDLPTVSIKGYEVLTPGTHTGIRGGANTYTLDDLHGMAKAHAELRDVIRPVNKLGHGSQALLKDVEYPNCGQIERAYVENDRLKFDLARVPAKIGALIKAGNLPARSLELLFNVQHNGKTYPKVITGLSFLGESQPAVRGLNDVLARYQDAARPDEVQLSADDVDEIALADAPTKSEGDAGDFPARCYAYVPDASSPSTWKLRLYAKPGDGTPDPTLVGAAAAALGKGYRGQKADIPSGDRAGVVAKVRAAWKKANPDKKPAEMPDGIALAAKSASAQAEEDAAACDDPKHADLTPALHKKLHLPKKTALALNLDEVRAAVEDALEDAYPYVQTPYGLPPSGDAMDGPSCCIEQLYDESVVVWDQDHDALWQAPYTYDAASATATLGEPQRVRLVPEAIADAEMADATTPHAISAGGGSVPGEASGMDTDYAPHLQAIQGHLDAIGQHLDGLAGKHGVGPARAMHRELTSKVAALQKRLAPESHTESVEETEAASAMQTQMAAVGQGETVNDTELRALLGLGPDADLKQELIALAARRVELADYQGVVAERDALLAAKHEAEAGALVDTAISAGKLLPKQRQWAINLAQNDRASLEAFLASAPTVWETGERGRSGESVTPRGEQPPNEAALQVAAKLGVDPAALAEHTSFAERYAAQVQERAKKYGSVPGLQFSHVEKN